MEHIAGVEELVLVVPPEVAALAAEIAPLVFFLHYFAGVFHLEIDYLFPAVKAEYQIRAGIDVYAEHFLDVRAGFGFIVEPYGARAQPAAHQVGAGAHCRVEVLEQVRAELAGFGNRVNFEGHFRNHAKRAFASKEHHCHIGAGSVARYRQSIDYLAGGGDDFEAHYHVLDFAPFCREHTRTAVGEESAYRSASYGRGQMHCRVSALIDSPFEVAGDDARFSRHGEGFFVYFKNFVHALGVEDNSSERRERPALRT